MLRRTFLLLFAFGCGAPAVPPPAAPEVSPVITRNEQALPLLGQQVRVQGTARDAKLSAVIEGESLLVFCLGQGEDGYEESRWPPDALEQPVIVTGRLVQTDQFAASVGPDGAIGQGTEGPILGLLEFQYELSPAAAGTAPAR
ncbi:MAG: hypothetical protein ABIO70_30485 [Pseudomonadota bacterium]